MVGGFSEVGVPRLNDVAARTMTKTDMIDFIWTEGVDLTVSSNFEVLS